MEGGMGDIISVVSNSFLHVDFSEGVLNVKRTYILIAIYHKN